MKDDRTLAQVAESFGIIEARRLRKLTKAKKKELNVRSKKNEQRKKTNMGAFKWRDRVTGFALQIVLKNVDIDEDSWAEKLKVKASVLYEMINPGKQTDIKWINNKNVKSFEDQFEKFLANAIERAWKGDVSVVRSDNVLLWNTEICWITNGKHPNDPSAKERCEMVNVEADWDEFAAIFEDIWDPGELAEKLAKKGSFSAVYVGEVKYEIPDPDYY